MLFWHGTEGAAIYCISSQSTSSDVLSETLVLTAFSLNLRRTLGLLKMFCYRISFGKKIKKCSKMNLLALEFNLETKIIQTKIININQHRNITHTSISCITSTLAGFSDHIVFF